MSDPGTIRIKDFDYELPAEQIAQFPLATRDASKLLIYDNGRIQDAAFSELDRYLPSNSLLVFNNTRVIRARLIFNKSTGGLVEIFCLEPLSPTREIQEAFHQATAATWKCLVGNLKRWKSGTLVRQCTHDGNLYRMFADRAGDGDDGTFNIAFHWDPPEKTFSEILELMGHIPLPPYITRQTEQSDNERYQTIYAAHEGSVAAPTAGLHFTTGLFDRLHSKGIETDHVTLHVGVGTFRPVSVEQIGEHVMHHEKIVVSKKSIERLLNNLDRPVFAIGTTSARTLESLYWLGVKLFRQGSHSLPAVSQWYPYHQNAEDLIPVKQSLEILLGYLGAHHLEEYSGETQLMIVPGYRFRFLSGLLTNFHMPQSTLLLLVAAMIGDDWQTCYAHALRNGYRFLSYGDSSLFFNQQV